MIQACGWWGDGESDDSSTAVIIDRFGQERRSDAVVKGSAEEAFASAERYRKGAGVVRDIQKAIHYYHVAAKEGHIGAQYTLGKIFSEGQLVDPDYELAANWYRLAASKGEVHSQHHLAEMYLEGRGVPRDLNSALSWYQKSAILGHWEAAFKLASLLATLDPPHQDWISAYAWLDVARRSGVEELPGLYSDLQRKMNKKQLDDAAMMADQLWARMSGSSMQKIITGANHGH